MLKELVLTILSSRHGFLNFHYNYLFCCTIYKIFAMQTETEGI